jgi:GT2 family glycosyltransferase
VIVVNNGGGQEIDEAKRAEGVTVISSGRNVGFAAGCNVGAAEASGQVLVFLNPDTVAAPGAIAALARAAGDPAVGVAMARLRLLDEPELLNSGGNVVHVSGLAWAGRYREPAACVSELLEVPFASGAAMAVRAEIFRELGGFTEELFMYLEDLELGWRARLRGLRIVITPDADVFHEYEFNRNRRKQYLIERNRLVFVLSAYSLRLLLLAAPVLFATEVGLLGLAAKQGWLRDKLAGWAWLAGHARWLVRHRRETQRLRRVPDRELAQFLTPVLDPAVVDVPRVVPVANAVMRRYWALARRAL